MRTRRTLRDVAEAVGVHVSTVSRALDPRTRAMVNARLAAQILAAAAALDVRPDAIAASLRTRRSRTIGVLLPDITNPIFPPMVRGLEDHLLPLGYLAVIINTDNDPAQAAAAVSMLRGRGVEGIVLASATLDDPLLAALLAAELPVVAVNRTSALPGLSAVTHDDAGGIGLVVAHLLGLGHRGIGHIAGPAELSTGSARELAFDAALAAAGLAGAKVTAARFTEAEGRQRAHQLLDTAPRVTAIVAANDLLAVGAMAALAERGLACPGQVSVTGFNDMPLVDRLSPALTTVHIQLHESGRLAAAAVCALIDGAAGASNQVLPVRLVVRASTAPPGG